MSAHHIIEKYYKAFNEWDLITFFSLLTEDVIHDVNNGEREIGIEKFRKFMQSMEKFGREKVDDMCIFTNGDRAAVEFMVEGAYRVTVEGYPPAKGQKYRLPVGTFFEFKKDKISRVTVYYNLQEWIRQVTR
jgi:steroid delta-isomerase-like uncharacterized protein